MTLKISLIRQFYKGTIAVVETSRGVQFPMFALDVSREVEGYVAEASIRSRHLKTEAGDIPGGEGGGGRCVAARAGTEKGGKHLEAQAQGTTTYYGRKSRYINIGCWFSLSALKPTQGGSEKSYKSERGQSHSTRVDIISWILPPSSTSWTAFTSTRLRTPPGQTTTKESPQWFSRDLSRGTPPLTPWSLSPTGGKLRGKFLSSQDFQILSKTFKDNRRQAQRYKVVTIQRLWSNWKLRISGLQDAWRWWGRGWWRLYTDATTPRRTTTLVRSRENFSFNGNKRQIGLRNVEKQDVSP